MKKKDYYVITSGKAIKDVFCGIDKLENARLIYPSYYFQSNIIKTLFRIRCSTRLEAVFSGPLSQKWDKYYATNFFDFQNTKENVLIFAPGLKISSEINVHAIKKIKESGNVRIVLALFDSISCMSDKNIEALNLVKGLFDLVVTYDAIDARTYGFVWFQIPYKKLKNITHDKIKYDLVFIGNDKGRFEQLKRIGKQLDSQNIKYRFWIMNASLLNRICALFRRNIVCTNKRIPYEQVIQIVNDSNCVLEVLCKGQTNSSLRYYESIAYDKKLLTNNRKVCLMPNFNEDNVKVFDSTNDLDIEWIRSRCKIDNGYQEYSITDFLEFISDNL